jgi:hypothetical protein
MRIAEIHKRHRSEIKSMTDGWRRLLSSYSEPYQSKLEKERCEGLKRGIVKYEKMLNSTDDEYIYTFQGIMVNGILPEMMKF